MIKILKTQQIKELDAYTIEHESISSIDLMERACRAFTHWFSERFDATSKIGVVCGTGNNGGDGLGIARLLKEWSYDVKVWIIRGNNEGTNDFRVNLDRLKELKVQIIEANVAPESMAFEDRDILIDALFGSGLSRTPEGVFAQTINNINAADAIRVAVDIPSGLMADKASSGAIVKAHYTVTFQLPKLAFLFPGSLEYVGDWTAVDIGLSKPFIKDAETRNYLISRKGVKRIFKPRSKFDHKGTFGHALLVSGSFGKIGAAVLGSRAALRSGVGLLTTHVPACGYSILQTAVPEAMISTDGHNNHITSVPEWQNITTVGIGPGIGQAKETIKAFASLMEKFRKPMVIDADALNILGANRELFHLVPEGSILTPHPKEFERLAGPSRDDFERLEKQRALASQLRSVILVKGAYTAVAAPDGCVCFNSTGNPGMATGGSGDVLTGILTGLLAQKYHSWEATVLGVYVHGLAGDLAIVEKGMNGLIASDLVEFLPSAFLELKR
jgi:NAD(P)H-hydrate epimerase